MTSKPALLVVAALALLAVGVGIGRFSVPTKKTETEKTSSTTLNTATTADRTIESQATGTDHDTRQVVRRKVTKREAPAVPSIQPPAGQPCPACPAVHEEITEEETVAETSDETGTVTTKGQEHVEQASTGTSTSAERTVVTERRGSAFGLEAAVLWNPRDFRPASPDWRVEADWAPICPLLCFLRVTGEAGQRVDAAGDRQFEWRVGVKARVEF